MPGLGLSLMLFAGCQLRETDHPLAHVEHIELCALLPAWPVAGMKQVSFPSPEPGLTGVCNLVDTHGDLQLNLALVNNRALTGKLSQDTERLFSIKRQEAAANGGIAPTALGAGDWRHAIAFRLGETRLVLIEDRGILLSLQSRTLAPNEIEAYARRVATALRTADAVRATTSSSAAASPRP